METCRWSIKDGYFPFLTQIHAVIKKNNLAFWTLTCLFLIVLFSGSLSSLLLSFYFVTFLMPVVIATSLYFSEVLVPRFLMTERFGQFALHFFYLLVLSIYGEMLVIMLAFVLIADYNIENLGGYAGDIRLLALIMYLIVFGHGFVKAFIGLKNREQRLNELLAEEQKEKVSTIVLSINRKKVPISINNILFIESLSDYVKVHLEDDVLITRERISYLESELPSSFIRIHRSFLVNKNRIKGYSREEVEIGEVRLNIGRKYKADTLSSLES